MKLEKILMEYILPFFLIEMVVILNIVVIYIILEVLGGIPI